MDFITGIIDYSRNQKAAEVSSTSFGNGIFQLETSRNHVFNYDSENLFFDDEKNTLISTIGYFTNLDAIRKKYKLKDKEDIKVLSKLFNSLNHNVLQELDGVFLILFYQIQEKKIQIFQSSFGMGLPFYYFFEDGKLVFGTSLKKILIYKKRRAFNAVAARDFIFYAALIPNEQTLIDGISKLVPNYILEFDLDKQEINKIQYDSFTQRINFKKAKQELLQKIEKSLIDVSANLSHNAAITHTGGWDTNLMLYYLRKHNSDKKINTVTISGGDIYDEIKDVKRIQKTYYSNLALHSSKVEPEINNLINLVWIYEGYIFQEGMFLRHELATLLNNKGLKTIILGATADQILYQPTKLRNLKRDLKENRIISFIKRVAGKKRDPERVIRKTLERSMPNKDYYLIDVEMLLKMHGIMLNHYDVTALFPYLSKPVAAAGKALKKINKNKRFYKQRIREKLGSDFTSNFVKSHSLVDTKKIFKLNKIILMELFRHYKEIILEFIDVKTYNRILSHPGINYMLIIHCIYLCLFHELFVTGKYDDVFSELDLNISLNDFVSK